MLFLIEIKKNLYDNVVSGKLSPERSSVMKKLPLLFTLALATVAVTGCDAFSFINGGTTPEPEGGEVTPTDPGEGKKEDDPEEIFIEDILLESYSETLEIGDTYQIDYEVWPRGAYNEVSFDSSNTSVATVSVNGLVEAKAEGNSVITLTSIQDTSVTAELFITVKSAPISNYTVSFNANGGSGTMANDTTTGSKYLTPNCAFTKTNYTFNGWALNSASGTKYAAAVTIFDISDDITLYATWKENSQPVTYYTVTYDKNGGTGSMTDSNSPYVENSKVTVLTNQFSRDGYDFVNFNTEANGSGTSYIPDATFTITSNVTLYAQWKEKSSGEGGYYDGITATSGTRLAAQLHDLITSTHTNYTSYDDNGKYGKQKETDRYYENGVAQNGYIYEFYSGVKWPDNWDPDAGSTNGGYNREHCWCQSNSVNANGTQMWGTEGGGADMHHIRPTENRLNSKRSNDKYGEVSDRDSYKAYARFGTNDTYALGGYSNNGTFEPLDSKKGDVARIIMYVYIHYNSYTISSLFGSYGTTNGNSSHSSYFTSSLLSVTKIMKASSESDALALLLSWNNSDPVDEIEQRRNNKVAEIQGNRNPFIDNSDYANMIWGN